MLYVWSTLPHAHHIWWKQLVSGALVQWKCPAAMDKWCKMVTANGIKQFQLKHCNLFPHMVLMGVTRWNCVHYTIKQGRISLQPRTQLGCTTDLHGPCHGPANYSRWMNLYIHIWANIFSYDCHLCDVLQISTARLTPDLTAMFCPRPGVTVPIRSDVYNWVKFNSENIILLQIQVCSTKCLKLIKIVC